MGLSLNSEIKSPVETEMNTDENVLVDKDLEETETKQMLPICKGNSFQNETTTEDNQNQSADKQSDKITNKKSIKLSFKKCDKSTEDLKVLSNQLHKFLKYIWRAQEFSYYVCDLPSQLQNKLEADAKELESIYLQILASSKNIETIKTQNRAIQKEKHLMKEILLLKTEEEQQEMEMIVSIYDKVMYTRWEALKNCQSETAVENFLVDVEGKLRAMKNLQKLVCDKLFKIQEAALEANKENDLNKKDNKCKKNNSTKGETKKSRGLKRYERVDFFTDEQGWDPMINSQHPSTSSFYSSHATSTDSFLESESDDTINTALHIEMNSVLQALFGEQIPLSSSALSDADNSINSVDVD